MVHIAAKILRPPNACKTLFFPTNDPPEEGSIRHSSFSLFRFSFLLPPLSLGVGGNGDRSTARGHRLRMRLRLLQ